MDPYNEDKIKDEDRIIRRINPEYHVVDDRNYNCKRVSTKAFSPSSSKNGGMSVDILDLIEKANINPQEFVTTPVFTGSVIFTAGEARGVQLIVGYHPIKDNPYHGEVWGSNEPNKFSKSQKKALLAKSKWFVELPNVNLNL